jgi:DNA-binding NtrC family response regulator
MKNIMIIDDEIEITDILQRYLNRKENIQAVSFSNPDAALEDMKRKNYDLILCDIMMPTTDGFDILKAIKSFHPQTKVILMTAYNTYKKQEKAQEFEADGYLTKPFNSMQNVQNTILATLEKP